VKCFSCVRRRASLRHDDDNDSDDDNDNKNKDEFKKYRVADASSAVYYAPGHLIQFGSSDLIIGSNSNDIQNSSSFLGDCYDMGYDGENLCGSVKEFKVKEIEVFLVKHPKEQ